MNVKTSLPPLKYPEYYDFLINLPPEKYVWYLKLLFWKNRRYRLNIEQPKTICEKIQWLKLYNSTSLKRDLTDKILVRDYVAKEIGEQYLKNVFQASEHFDQIDFNALPNKFFIKCNHGCKWQFLVKDKLAFVSNERLKNIIKQKIEKWLSMKFFAVGGLELQYQGIKPLVYIEEPIQTKDEYLSEFEIYCFNGKPKIVQKVIYSNPARRSVWNESFETSTVCFDSIPNIVEAASDEIKKATELSGILAKDFKLVRVDWILGDRGLYFNEMTFTPYSGFIPLKIENEQLLGDYLDLTKGK